MIPGALPLGILAQVAYANCSVQLKPGDRLTFVSDGVVEAQAKAQSKAQPRIIELFGFDRTRALSQRSASEIAEAARVFGQTDDITVVTLEFLGAPKTTKS